MAVLCLHWLWLAYYNQDGRVEILLPPRNNSQSNSQGRSDRRGPFSKLTDTKRLNHEMTDDENDDEVAA